VQLGTFASNCVQYRHHRHQFIFRQNNELQKHMTEQQR